MFLMALKASSGLLSTEKAVAKFGLLMVLSSILSGVHRGHDALRSGRPLPRARLIVARGDEPAQIAVHKDAPRVRALVVAFVRRRQASMCEARSSVLSPFLAISKTMSVPFHSSLSCTNLRSASSTCQTTLLPGTNSVIFCLERCASGTR